MAPTFKRNFLILMILCFSWPMAAGGEFSETALGDRMRDDYFRAQVTRIRENSLKNIKTKADWQKEAPRLRQQFFEMMGLWPLPERTDLKPVVTGIYSTETISVEKVHFQSSPGLYVTGNLYLPRQRTGKVPAVLYVCGHGNLVRNETVDGKKVQVSYGSKALYHYHPVWFAQNGYACLVIDTLQLGEIEGVHHGTYNRGMWWWQSLGYTSAGVECWNAMRALDYLQSRSEIDPEKLGVTGRSGGGATSWWIAAADERIKCAVPVAGIADLHAHLLEGLVPRLKHGVINGHCDCMYFYNLYQWDFPQVMALCAPRAVMLGNSDQDPIFPVPGYQRMVPKVRAIYDLLGAPEKFSLLETKGDHVDTVELRTGINSWMNRWLKGMKQESAPEHPLNLDPMFLKVLAQPPADELNTRLHDFFIKPARWESPGSAPVFEKWWEQKKSRAFSDLRDKVFRNWPSEKLPLNARKINQATHDGLRLTAWDFQSDEQTTLRLFVMDAERSKASGTTLVEAMDEKSWQAMVATLGSKFADVTIEGKTLPGDAMGRKKIRESLEKQGGKKVFVVPRGMGLSRWSDSFDLNGKPAPLQIKRRFALLGQTVDSMRVWDVRRAIQVASQLESEKQGKLELTGKDEMAGIALYAGIFEPSVGSMKLENLSPSHMQGPTFLNVLRVLDIPQAIALAAPRKVQLRQSSPAGESFAWTRLFEKKLGVNFFHQEFAEPRKE